MSEEENELRNDILRRARLIGGFRPDMPAEHMSMNIFMVAAMFLVTEQLTEAFAKLERRLDKC